MLAVDYLMFCQAGGIRSGCAILARLKIRLQGQPSMNWPSSPENKPSAAPTKTSER